MTLCSMSSLDFLWDDLTVGKLGVSCMEGEKWNIWQFETCFGRFFLLEGVHRGPPRVLKGPKWTSWCSMRSRDTKLYYGMIYLWEN